MILLSLSAAEALGFRQNGHLCWSLISSSLTKLARRHPLHIVLPQHSNMVDFDASRGIGKQQIGQSPQWLLSGCLNNNSSRSSAARFLHASSCSGRWSSRHVSLQYWTRSQESHSFNSMSSTAAMLHEAQHDMQHHDDVSSSSLIVILFYTTTFVYLNRNRRFKRLWNSVTMGEIKALIQQQSRSEDGGDGGCLAMSLHDSSSTCEGVEFRYEFLPM